MTATRYVSFLLRLWRVSVQGVPACRASLQRPGAAEVLSFADLESLLAFLRAEMEMEKEGRPMT